MTFTGNISNQSFDQRPFDGPIPDFVLPLHERRNADVNDGVFKLGGTALKPLLYNYELKGAHSMALEDIIEKTSVEETTKEE